MALSVMSEPLLVVEHLFKSFDGVDAVHDVSFSVHPGEIVAMIGPNGAGKTTCFNLIHGELRPDAGDIRLDGASIVGLPTHAIAHHGVGRTFQIPAMFASMTVRESVALALDAARSPDAGAIAALLPMRSARVSDMLAHTRLDDLADAHCASLAYGDAKRVEVALALTIAPRLLLMDEPTAGMTARSRHELMRLAVELAGAGRIALLFTEHDMDIVFGFAERVIVLDRGKVIAEGAPEQIRENREVLEAYLG
jgi:branched-chain amino acid transport system ATP-binding protein